MKTSTKIILFIIALLFISPFTGKNSNREEVYSGTVEETKASSLPETSVNEGVQTEEVLIEETFADNAMEDELSVDSADEDDKTYVSDGLEVHFLDVGQGDASLIICGDEAMLVDAGDEGKGTAIQLYLKKHNIDRLKYVVATHPDADHIGGLDVIVYKFDCGQILIPNCENDTSSYEQLQYSMKAKGYSPHVVDVGEIYTLGDAQIEILSPSAEFTFADTNDSSIVFRLDHGNNSFLFTGDATIPPQQALIYDPDLDIDVDVLKVPHHGAATAYIKGFYDEVSPEYAVISCGLNNSYGHPRHEVLDDLKNRGSKVFRTDEQGTIVAFSDGDSISFSTVPSESWLAGDSNEVERAVEETVISSTKGSQNDQSEPPEAEVTYVYNKNKSSKKFHYPDCPSVSKMKPENRVYLNCTREELINTYPEAQPCKNCNP
ncbi:MAG: MBL fold metallo-hydrolase [Lachnospiraceae bacterium]|nr:MBL fold metallo-hydrolase [Lachnospiraceae bacterium]